jgi:hypothetical protein
MGKRRSKARDPGDRFAGAVTIGLGKHGARHRADRLLGSLGNGRQRVAY